MLVLLCAVVMFVPCRLASANADGASDSIVIAFEPGDVNTASDATVVDVGAVAQGVLSGMVKVEGVRGAVGRLSNAAIPSSNPDDAAGHAAWRKRAADAGKAGMQTLRQAMMLQAAR